MKIQTRKKFDRMCVVVAMLGCVVIANTTLIGCGNGNLFSSAVSRDDKDNGQLALQNGDYAGAAEYLKSYIAANPSDAQARSMLTTALLKLSGIDEMQIAASISSASSSSSGDWSTIVGAMPAGTEQNIANLVLAKETIEAIPAEQRTSDQNYQLAVASAALGVTVAKKTLTNSSGAYAPTTESIQAISDTDAELILSSISTTATAATASGNSSTGLSKLGGIESQILAQTGATPKEQLQNFLISKI
jgi:alkyl sulfatase BDS1-like metallo-beta-lactamase superfamily hydrolase